MTVSDHLASNKIFGNGYNPQPNGLGSQALPGNHMTWEFFGKGPGNPFFQKRVPQSFFLFPFSFLPKRPVSEVQSCFEPAACQAERFEYQDDDYSHTEDHRDHLFE